MVKLGVDIDGVVCAILPSVLKFAHMKYQWPVNYEVKTWNPSERGVSLSAIIDDFLSHPAYVQSLPAVCGAQECVEILSKSNDIVFITHRPAKCAESTREWLNDNIGDFPVIHATKSKAEYGVDVMVDDNLQNCWDFIYSGKFAMLFDQPYNQETFPLRVTNWKSVVFLLREHLASNFH